MIAFAYCAGEKKLKAGERILQTGSVCQHRRLARASQHQALLAEVKAVYDSTVDNWQSPLPPSSTTPSLPVP
jgi:hypothetical protein